MVGIEWERNEVSTKEELLLNPEENDSVIDVNDAKYLKSIVEELHTNEDNECINELISSIDKNFDCWMKEHIPDILKWITQNFLKTDTELDPTTTTTLQDMLRSDIAPGEREMFLSFLTWLQKYDQDNDFGQYSITLTQWTNKYTIDISIQNLLSHLESVDNNGEDVTNDLFALEEWGLDTAEVPAELEWLVNDILQDPPKPPEKQQQETIRWLIKQGKVWEALTQTMDLLISIFFGSKEEAWLEDFQKYTIEYSELSDEDLQDKINRLSYKIRNGWISVNQRVRFCYALSRAKDEKLERENPDITVFEKLWRNIKKGDVLLMNKDAKEQWFNIEDKLSNEWLQTVSSSPRTHTVLVTKIEWDSIEITHASWSAKKVVTQDLSRYLQFYKATDICVLQQPQESRQKSVEYAKSLVWAEYDDRAAVYQALWKENKQDDKYNCGELVGDSLLAANSTRFEDLEQKTYPSDFLISSYLMPSYMTTIYS